MKALLEEGRGGEEAGKGRAAGGGGEGPAEGGDAATVAEAIAPLRVRKSSRRFGTPHDVAMRRFKTISCVHLIVRTSARTLLRGVAMTRVAAEQHMFCTVFCHVCPFEKRKQQDPLPCVLTESLRSWISSALLYTWHQLTG